MKVNSSEHLSRDWRVHALAVDFDLLDVWRLPVVGEAGESLDDFEVIMAGVQERLMSRGPAGWLFRLRFWLGRVFKWDEAPAALPIPGCEEVSLRDRLPEDLARSAAAPEGAVSGVDFTDVYRLPDEMLKEISNQTVHALLHTGKVPLGEGRWGLEMAVYVKARGSGGRAYMALIDPFRHLIVYPAMMRLIEAAWSRRRDLDSI